MDEHADVGRTDGKKERKRERERKKEEGRRKETIQVGMGNRK